MKRFCLFVFIFCITFSASAAERKADETPFEYNFRWYQNDFKWWNVWHKELYEGLGKYKPKDVYNAGQVISSINRLKNWVLPEKLGLFEDYTEFYEMINGEVEKGNLRKPEIRAIQSLLKEKEKKFIAELHYKKINPEEWISKEIKDKSLSQKVEITTMPITSAKEKTGYRYVAHRNGKVFHKLNCEAAEDIKEIDRVYFKTKRKALSTIRKPCRQCKP